MLTYSHTYTVHAQHKTHKTTKQLPRESKQKKKQLILMEAKQPTYV